MNTTFEPADQRRLTEALDSLYRTLRQKAQKRRYKTTRTIRSRPGGKVRDGISGTTRFPGTAPGTQHPGESVQLELEFEKL